jgi:copper chaperone CopZ
MATIGGSNGGLLMGAMMTQRPDLFGAIICQVPLLDMLRYQEFLMARYWVPEYGDPANPEHFAFIKKYSPYHNVTQGTKFPGIMFTAGENDARTHPMHARKMAAKVRDANTSDRPVLLWVDREAGHGGGKPLELRLRDSVDTRMFIMWQLGMLDGLAPNQLPQGATSQAETSPQFTITRVVSLNVTGMTCEMCVDTVTTTLKGVKGVKNVNVSLEKKAADIELENDSDLDGVTLAKALEGTKFKATPK